MLDADRERLHDKLIDLMVMRTSREEGAPYVRADGSFGLYCGDTMGGLYSAYHLIDALKTGGLFTGAQAPRSDLDTAMYEFSRDTVLRPFGGVRLFWNETRQMQLEIKTDKPLENILAALDAGIQDAKRHVRQRFNEKAAWEDGALKDYQRDHMPPVFGPAVDEAFFQAYMRYRFEKDLGVTSVSIEEEELDDNSKKILKDERPRQNCLFDGSTPGAMHPSAFVSDLEKNLYGQARHFHPPAAAGVQGSPDAGFRHHGAADGGYSR